MADPLNEIFAELKMDSSFLDWRTNLPSETPFDNNKLVCIIENRCCNK